MLIKGKHNHISFIICTNLSLDSKKDLKIKESEEPMQEKNSKDISYTVIREYTGKYTPEQLIQHIIKIHT